MDRRRFLTGLLAAPAIVRASSLMRIAPPPKTPWGADLWGGETWPTIGYVVGYDRAIPDRVAVSISDYGGYRGIYQIRLCSRMNPEPRVGEVALAHSSGAVVTLPSLRTGGVMI